MRFVKYFTFSHSPFFIERAGTAFLNSLNSIKNNDTLKEEKSKTSFQAFHFLLEIYVTNYVLMETAAHLNEYKELKNIVQ